MNPFSIPTFLTSFLVFVFGMVVFFKNFRSPSNQSFALVCFTTTIWLLGASVAYNVNEQDMAERFLRICYVGITFIPVTLFHFVNNLLNIKNIGKYLIPLYLLSLIAGLLVLFDNSILNGVHRYFWGFYPHAGKFHPIFLIVFVLIVTLCVIILILNYIKSNTSIIKRSQIRYVLIAIFIFNFSSFDFIANYGISFYPFGYLAVTSFLAIIAYSIVRYRLLDIKLVITRTGIFIAVYSIVLGIPFAIAFGLKVKLVNLLHENWWIVPLVSSTVLATAGPFIYLFIQKKAEDSLLQEQKRYQATLRQASSGMGRIKDLKRLLNLIVHIVTRAVHLNHSSVYLFDSLNKRFILGAYRKGKEGLRLTNSIENESSLIKYLFKTRSAVVYEEIKQKTQDYGDRELAQVEVMLEELEAALVVPSFIEDRLLAIIVMGKKRSEKLYSEGDLATFTILANQAALAIENAQFYEDMKRTQAQLFKAEKMATIGTMADGLSHQINNRLHALGFIAGDALDSIKMKSGNEMPVDIKQLLVDLEFALGRVQDNVKQGGEIVQGLLKYTRKGDQGMMGVDLEKLLKASFEMVQYKVKLNQLSIVREFAPDLPPIKGNFTQLQEVFFNLIDNANDAMIQRKTEKMEPDYKPRLSITAAASGDWIEINVVDNGIGVRKEDVEKLFTPFFTTKLSSKKGTGLGLYVIQKIIEENHGGKVKFFSDYMKGTRFLIHLPIA